MSFQTPFENISRIERERYRSRLGEVGIVCRCPEHRRNRQPGDVLQLIGESARGDRFRQRHQRTAEQTRLLSRRDDESLAGRAALKPSGRGARRVDCRRKSLEPFRVDAVHHTLRMALPCVPRVGTRHEPLRQLAGAPRARERRSAEGFGDDDRIGHAGTIGERFWITCDRARRARSCRRDTAARRARDAPARAATSMAQARGSLSRAASRHRPVRTRPDEDRNIARPLAKLLKPRGELLGRQGFSDYIACDNLRTGRKGREQALAFPFADEVRGTGSCRLFADLVKL